jgi:hypothetical protein
MAVAAGRVRERSARVCGGRAAPVEADGVEDFAARGAGYGVRDPFGGCDGGESHGGCWGY